MTRLDDMVFDSDATAAAHQPAEEAVVGARLGGLPTPPHHVPLTIYAGVISSDPGSLLSLLRDLDDVAAGARIARLVVVVLTNGASADGLAGVVQAAAGMRSKVVFLTEAKQRSDALLGAFGGVLRDRPRGRVGIASARTMLQRYVGVLMSTDLDAFGWLLDDDMRVDPRARWYLSWLPAFRARGVDVLIGGIEGASPNPPLHGVQGQLFDLLHNMTWLKSLPPTTALPDRSVENRALRAKFPDYYYDLSRKHTEHLHQPHWLEPAFEGEPVARAYARLIDGARRIPSGAPLTRPLVAPMPADPLAAARDSVNRGGHTFVLNHRALTETPNPVFRTATGEARRSDMFWAIVNRHYRCMSIKAVAFPAIHVGRVAENPTLDIEKVSAEISGAALYAALTAFLHEHPQHRLEFSQTETTRIERAARCFRDERMAALATSFERSAALRDGSLRAVARSGELTDLLATLDAWFTPGTLERIRGVVARAPPCGEAFLASLRNTADDYAAAPPPDLRAVQAELGQGGRT